MLASTAHFLPSHFHTRFSAHYRLPIACAQALDLFCNNDDDDDDDGDDGGNDDDGDDDEDDEEEEDDDGPSRPRRQCGHAHPAKPAHTTRTSEPRQAGGPKPLRTPGTPRTP